LKLKAKFETGPLYFSFERLVPAASKVGLKGSACTALPHAGGEGRDVGRDVPLGVAAQLKLKPEVESIISTYSFNHLVPGGFNVG